MRGRTRTLIKSGSSLVVTVPSEYVKKLNWQSGDLIVFEQIGEQALALKRVSLRLDEAMGVNWQKEQEKKEKEAAGGGS